MAILIVCTLKQTQNRFENQALRLKTESMVTDIPPEEFARCLDECAAAILAEAKITEPPIDVIRLAQQLGFVVAVDKTMRGRARFVRLSGRYGGRLRSTILVAPETRCERRQWAVAHELGEATSHRVFSALGLHGAEAAPSTREYVANHLAGCLLLPKAWFTRDAWAVDWNLASLKTRDQTASHELIARRMLDVDAPAIISVFDQSMLTWRRSNLPGRVPAVTALERQIWQACHNHGQPTSNDHSIERIECWPVHEPQQKREIMRTEVFDAM